MVQALVVGKFWRDVLHGLGRLVVRLGDGYLDHGGRSVQPLGSRGFFLRVTAAFGPVEFGLSWIDGSAEALFYQGNPCVEQLEEVDGLLVVDLLL